ncbi:MAG: guanylate kinase [Flavobacteriaceae bacterium]|nr:guanylate kinase [Flavobacteriaceae bacterium]|tara:strand:+ start:13236 stop:13802 length:567 start_codon:yes stop_codon:yes gene_type:complete
MKKSKFIVIAAPSGSGKTTLVNKLLNESKLDLSFSISATSRNPRSNELDGKNYFFLSKEEFIKKIKNKEFLEWEEVYKDTFYGTLNSELENVVEKNLIFDIDVIGGLNIKEKFPDQTLTIFIKPPSIDELESRLKKRNSETGSSIKMRIKKAKNEILLADKFDCIVENDILKKSYSKVFKLVNNFINE